jgi:hypothetical protein
LLVISKAKSCGSIKSRINKERGFSGGRSRKFQPVLEDEAEKNKEKSFRRWRRWRAEQGPGNLL